jgi:hypothetical protein
VTRGGPPAPLSRDQVRSTVDGSPSTARFISGTNGAIVAQRPPQEIVTVELVRHVFRMECQVIADPETGTPLIVPASRERRRSGARQVVRREPRGASAVPAPLS